MRMHCIPKRTFPACAATHPAPPQNYTLLTILFRIIQDPTNPLLWTNRAMARLKLHNWEGVISDSEDSMRLLPVQFKANYYIAQAQLELGRPSDALEAALKAYEVCVKTNDKSLALVVTLVLRCKKEKWEKREKMRLREGKNLMNELVDMLEVEKRNMLVSEESESERLEIESLYEAKTVQLREIFGKADREFEKRVVPDYFIDDISFAIMHDPVVTKTGHSYERASIMEHLKRSATDPLTREPLKADDLKPNLGLKLAIEDWIANNGWAVDW